MRHNGAHPAGRCRHSYLRAIVATLTLVPLTACNAGGTGAETAPGQAIYERYCASCHGVTGDGQGPAAYLLFPKPRNFLGGQFKLRSTPQQVPPTDQDLVRTVSQGIPGTAMFDFQDVLAEEEIARVVQYVKSLSPVFAGTDPESQVLSIPATPPMDPELVRLGRDVYVELRCAQCHGPEGRGDGPSAPTLRDNAGDPFPAADFTYGIYKSGGEPRDLYRTFLTGMPGTPMPSYASSMEESRRGWALVYYLMSLSDQDRPVTGDPGPVAVTEVPDMVPLEAPWADEWNRVTPHMLVLRPLWYRNDFPPSATIRAARSADRIAVLVEWSDERQDRQALEQGGFSDAVALQLALTPDPPFMGMGENGPGGNVEIWYWRAERQLAAEQGHPETLADVYPDMAVDRYPFARGEGSSAEDSAQARARAEQEAPFVAGRDVGNPVSDPELMQRPVHEMAARGFGTLTTRSAEQMRTSGNGSFRDGTYRVVFTAPLAPADPALEADLRQGLVPMAVAIWDGGAGDRNGTKLVTQWVRLDLGGQAGTTAAGEESDDR